MSKQTFQDVVIYLQKLKGIYELIGHNRKDIHAIEDTISAFKKNQFTSIENFVTATSGKESIRKTSFSETLDLILNGKNETIRGTKINYQEINTSEKVINYFETSAKTKVIRETTVLDLKLLYCLLIGEKNELKGTKNEVYEAIKGNIRARNRGKAFNRMI